MVRSDLGLTGDDNEEIEPPPALFWYPKEYVLRTWRYHQKHGTYPNGGAYNELDPQLDEDWQRITARYNYLFDQLRPRDDGDGNRSSKRDHDVFAELASDEPENWQSMMGD